MSMLDVKCTSLNRHVRLLQSCSNVEIERLQRERDDLQGLLAKFERHICEVGRLATSYQLYAPMRLGSVIELLLLH